MSSTITITEAQPVEFTAAQVAEHKGQNGNWIIVHGQVLDVSHYINDHPGGIDVLKEAAGQDATEAFNSAGHSDDALEIMAEFRVGLLQGYKKPTPKRTTIPVTQPTPVPIHPRNNPSSSIPVAAAATTALALSASAYYLTTPALTNTTQTLLKPILSRLIPSTANSFPAGFLLASTITVLGAASAVHQMNNLTHFNQSFTHYPPHKPSSKPPPLTTPFLNPKIFQSLPLIRKVEIAPSVFRLVFALPTPDTILGLPTGQHVAIKATVDGKSVSRSYTPVSNNSDRGVLELVIRCYPDGQLTGKYIQNLRPGLDTVQFRGPKGAMRHRRGLAKHIGMVAGGTGITPMYQVIRAICEDPEDDTKISLVYANRREGDILLREELEEFAARYPEKLKVWYMLDVASEGWGYGVGHITGEVLRERMPGVGEDSRVFLCGPPGMVNAAKGFLSEMGYEMPGAVGKMEDRVFCF